MIEIDDRDLQRAANLLQAFPGAVDRLSKRAVRSSVKGVKREAAQKDGADGRTAVDTTAKTDETDQ